MLAQQRRTKILELLQEKGSARVNALSKLFQVSEPTIRQDLGRLETDGYITREHGGAYLKTIPEQVRSLTLQHTENMDKKMRIGKKAAGLISDGDFIILDAGTTVTEIAKNLGIFYTPLESGLVPFDIGMVVLPLIIYIIKGIVRYVGSDAVKDVPTIFRTVGHDVSVFDVCRFVRKVAMPFDANIG